MKIHCIATDMDGTLLNSKQKVSEANKRAIMEAKEKGIQVIVATGRSYSEARFPLDEAEIECPIICVNGAEIRDEKGGITHTTGMDSAISAEVANKLRDKGIYFEVYTNQGTYTEDYEKGIDIIIDIFQSSNPQVSEHKIREAAKERFSKGHISVIEDYEQIFHESSMIIYKFLAFSFDDDALSSAKELLDQVEGIAVSSSGRENLEITNVHAQKGIALEQFTKEQGLDMSKTMAIGDNFNDLSMMKKVGRPVAMGNAAEGIKEFCEFHSATNEEDGVAKAIFEVLKINV
ncbi:Cof-type HAD-IIB family hydrolase [Falsibacillus albus]|uniref:HAD family phosphatase n=1 Tax=Falsibacillus albus TaxID=2478915 RepID=A0A3L7JRH0_9BACI|nr:Cof-type HAD-IIB family hydrolase [Falsibacillus albus]RLQ93437.1 HAD family phosphatase [Falsibacillus albus]